jgi:hypothetical protein
VHYRNTIRRCERRSTLERNTTEEEIGGAEGTCTAGDLSIDGTQMIISRLQVKTCNFGVWEVFIRAQPEVAGSDWISCFQFGRLRSRPIFLDF